MHPSLNEVRVGWLCRCPIKVWEPIRKWAHTKLIREHSVIVTSACWATMNWSWPKSEISVRELISTSKKKKKSAGREWIVKHSPKILAREEEATTTKDAKVAKHRHKPEQSGRALFLNKTHVHLQNCQEEKFSIFPPLDNIYFHCMFHTTGEII